MKYPALALLVLGCGGDAAPPADTDLGAGVAVPMVDTAAPYDTTQLGPGPSCVFNRSDDRLIGTLVRLDSMTATVRLSPALAAEAGVPDTTTWEITVPRNGTIRPCT